MRRDLGREIDKQARQSARRIAPGLVRLGSGEVKQIGKDPSSRQATEVLSAPSVGSYRDLVNRPLVGGTLALVRRSDGFRYSPGTDFEEDVANSRWKNLTISSGTSLDATHFYYQSAGGGTSDHGLLTGLEDDDHTIYALADGSRGEFQPPGEYIEEGDSRLSDTREPTAHDHDDLYAALEHVHDAYLTEDEADGLYAPLTHNHDSAYKPIDYTPEWTEVSDKPTQFPPESHPHDLATQSAAGFLSAPDKTRLDGIESNATRDQTAAEIFTAVKTVDGTGSGLDADTLDGLHASEIGGSGGGDVGTVVRLEYNATTDIANGLATGPNGTWTNLGPSLSFTVGAATSIMEVIVSGVCVSPSNVECVGAVLLDGANRRIFGGGFTAPNYLAGTGYFIFTGLSAGTHSVRVQISSFTAAAAYCRCAAVPNLEALRVTVLERKQ